MKKKNFFIKNNKATVIITTLSIILMSYFTLNLKMDTGINTVLPENDPVFKYQLKIEKTFNGNESFIIALINKNGSIYSNEILESINFLNIKMNELNEKDIKNASLRSLLSMYKIYKKEDFNKELGLNFDKTNIENIRSFVKKYYFLTDKFISKDKKSTIVVNYVPTDFANNNSLVEPYYNELLKNVEILKNKYPDIDVKITGKPYIKTEIAKIMLKDMIILFPLSVLFFFILLFLMYKNIYFSFISIIVILFSIAFTFSLKGFFNSPITLVEPSIPVILIAISSAGVIHVLMEIKAFILQGYLKNEACALAIEKLKKSVILADITTSLGFGSLLFADNKALNNMGLYLMIGILISIFFTLSFVPALTSLLNFNFKIENKENDLNTEKYTRFLIKFRYLILIFFFVILGFSIIGTLKMKTDINEIDYFKDGTEVKESATFIGDTFSGLSILYLSIYQEEREKSTNEKSLIALVKYFDKLNKYLEKMDQKVSFTASFLDVIKAAYFDLPISKEKYELPKKDIQIKALLRIVQEKYKDERYNIELKQFINKDFNWSIYYIYLKATDTFSMREVIANIKEFNKTNLPEDYKTRFGGDFVRLTTANLIVKEQVKNLIYSIFGIFIFLIIVYRSFKVSFIITLPVAISVFISFGVMWLLKLSLNPATAIISSIGMGAGVDYGIHIYSRLNDHKKNKSKLETITFAIKDCLYPIMINAFSVSFGFMTLIASSYQIITDMGLIIALAMILSAMGSLILIPVLFFILFKD